MERFLAFIHMAVALDAIAVGAGFVARALIPPISCTRTFGTGRSYTLENVRNFSAIGGAANLAALLAEDVLPVEPMRLARLATRCGLAFRKRGATFPVRLRHIVAMSFFTTESELR